MVEELKLAIKIDDASIEQSLLKQFANAQKMADKVVLDFKNVNFNDKQIEAKFKEMQKKAGQNPIDLTIGGNTLDMLGQIDKRLTEIFSIGKGKSFIDSSSTVADIGKIENKINELNKKYEEVQKKLSSIGSGNISGKNVNLVDNAEFQKLTKEVSELKNQFDDLKTHMQLLDDYTIPTDRFLELQSQVKGTTVKVSDLVDEFIKLSNAQKVLSSTPQKTNNLSGTADLKISDLKSTIKNAFDNAYSEDKGLVTNLLFGSDGNIKSDIQLINEINTELDHIWNKYTGNATFDEKAFNKDILPTLQKFAAGNAFGLVNYSDIKAGNGFFSPDYFKQLFEQSSAYEFTNSLSDDLFSLISIAINAQQELREELEKVAIQSKQTEQAIQDVASAESSIPNGMKDAFPSTETTASVEKTTQAIKKENNALEETANKAKQAVSELVKGRDVVSQNWYREKGTVIGKDSKGNNITRDADEFSFVERLKNGQLQTVLATYDEETGKWAEQVINVKTAFEQVEKAIISADNKIASLEMSRDKTLATHSGYDTTADDNQIAIERKKRDELQNTLNLYGQEKEYVFEIEAANKRIADNQERLNNKKQSQINLRQTVSEEQFLKDWDAAIAENNKRNAESAKQQTKSIKEEWTNAVKAVKEYESAVTKLNNLKAQDKGLGTKKEEIEAQQKRIDELTSSFEFARNTIISFFASTDKFNTLPTNSIKEVSDVLKLIGTAAQGSAESVAHLESETRKMAENTVDQYTNKISSYYEKSTDYKKSYDKFSSDGWASSEYSSKINQLNEEIEILDQKIAEVSKKKIVTKDDNDQLEQYKNNIESTIHELKTMPATQKGYTNLSAQKMLSKINQLLKDNSNMSKKAKNDIRNWYNEIASGNPTASLDVILGKVQEIVNAEIDAGRGGKGMWDAIKEKAWYGAAGTIGTYFGVSDIIRYGKQAANIVKDLNTQITELAKVSEQSSKQIYADFDSYADIAKEVRGTISDTIAATADWSKNGYSIPDAKKLAEISQLYKNVGDGINIDEANKSLISTLKGFKLEAKEAEHIVDVFNEVSNNEAISSAGIGDALQRSAASFNAANTSLEQSVALVTATNSVLQDPEKVGKQNIAYLYSNVMKIKVAISVKLLRRTRPRKDYNICFNY